MSELDKLIEQFGQEQVDAIAGEWIARSHRERPRLFWDKPEGPARAPHYLAFVRQLNCCFCGAPPQSDPHHHGKRGMGQKTDDYRTMPVCRRCHDNIHDACGADPQALDRKVVDTLVRYLRIVEQT